MVNDTKYIKYIKYDELVTPLALVHSGASLVVYTSFTEAEVPPPCGVTKVYGECVTGL